MELPQAGVETLGTKKEAKHFLGMSYRGPDPEEAEEGGQTPARGWSLGL